MGKHAAKAAARRSCAAFLRVFMRTDHIQDSAARLWTRTETRTEAQLHCVEGGGGMIQKTLIIPDGTRTRTTQHKHKYSVRTKLDDERVRVGRSWSSFSPDLCVLETAENTLNVPQS